MSAKRKRTWLKRTLGLLLVLMAILLLGYAGLHSPWGRNQLANKLSNILSDKLQAQVTVEDLAGWLPFSFYAGGIHIAHEAEPCVTLLQSKMHFDAASLLKPSKIVRRADVEEVVYHRWLPPPPPGTPPSPLPQLHIETLNIRFIRLANLNLEEQDLAFSGTFSSQRGITLAGELSGTAIRLKLGVQTAPHPQWHCSIAAQPQSFLHARLRIPPEKAFRAEATNRMAQAWLPAEISLEVDEWVEGTARIEAVTGETNNAFLVQSTVKLDAALIPAPVRALSGNSFDAAGRLYIDGRIEQLHIHNPQFDLKGKGRISRDTGAIAADYELDLKDAAWPMGSNEIAAVQCVATGQVTRMNADAPFRLRLDARPRGLRGLPTPLHSLLGNTPSLTLDTTLTSPLHIESLTVSGTNLTTDVSGSVHRTDRTLQLDWELQIPRVHDLEALSDRPIRAALQGSGRITQSFDQPHVQANMQLPGAQYKDASFNDARISAALSRTAGGWQGPVNTTFSYREMPFDATGQVLVATNQISVSQFELKNADHSTASGAVAFNPHTRQVAGRVEARATDLATWGSTLDVPIAGRADATLTFLAQDEGFALDASVHAEAVKVKDITLDKTQWQLTRADLLDPALPWIATGRVDGVMMNSVRLPTTALSLNVNTQGVTGTFSSFVQATNLQVQVQGEFSHTPEQDRLQLKTADGEVAGKRLHLPEPLSAQRDATAWSLDPAEVHWGKVRAQVQGTLRDGQISAQVRAPELTISELLPATLSDLTGTLNAVLDIGGSPSNLTARLHGGITQLGVADPEFEDLAPFDLRFAAGLSNGLFRADAQLDHQGRPSGLHAACAFPASASATPTKLHIERAHGLAAQLDGHLDLGLINALPIAIDQRLQGVLAVDLRASGSLSQPSLSGSSTLRNGQYEHATLGTELNELQFNLVAREQQLILENLQGNGPTKGQISGRGHIALDPENGFPGAFFLNLKQLRLVQNDLLRAFAEGKLVLEGSTREAVLSGILTITPMDLHVPRHLPPASSKFVVIDPERNPTKQPLARPPDRKNENPLRLNVQVHAPGKLVVDGRGLRSTWSGNLQVTGPATHPQITGSLSPDRGTFDFFGQQFHLTESSVRFTGSVPPDPLLDVVFERKKPDFVVYLRVSGSSKAPSIRLDSEPPLPEEELLPQLLFGKDASELSPLQAIRMVRAANALKGGGSTYDLMGRARKWLSIDELEIEQAEDDNAVAKARVGKALNDRVYLEGESELGGDANALRLEIELTPRLSLESDIQSEMKRGIGLKWKRKF